MGHLFMDDTENTQRFVIFIPGQPFAQSRARVTGNGTYSSASASLKAWRARMEGELLRAIRTRSLRPLAGPLRMQLVFRLPTDKQARWGTYYPHKPDFDNLAKAVCDVAEKAGLFAVGDQQIADARIIKLWSSPAEAGVYVQLLELRPLKAEKNPAGGAGFLFGEHQG